jgi:hypothetical protein
MACGIRCASQNGIAALEPHAVFDSVSRPWSQMEGMGAVGSALRFDEVHNLHHGVAAKSLLGRLVYGCGSVHLVADQIVFG